MEWENGESTIEPIAVIASLQLLVLYTPGKMNSWKMTDWINSRRLPIMSRSPATSQSSKTSMIQDGIQAHVWLWSNYTNTKLSKIRATPGIPWSKEDKGRPYLRHKAQCVADGHLTDVPIESVYSGAISFRRLRIIIFLAELWMISVFMKMAFPACNLEIDWEEDDRNVSDQAKQEMPVTYRENRSLWDGHVGPQLYQPLIGFMQWAVSWTRMTIATAVMTLSGSRIAPQASHLVSVKRVCGYFSHFKDAAIVSELTSQISQVYHSRIWTGCSQFMEMAENLFLMTFLSPSAKRSELRTTWIPTCSMAC